MAWRPELGSPDVLGIHSQQQPIDLASGVSYQRGMLAFTVMLPPDEEEAVCTLADACGVRPETVLAGLVGLGLATMRAGEGPDPELPESLHAKLVAMLRVWTGRLGPRMPRGTQRASSHGRRHGRPS